MVKNKREISVVESMESGWSSGIMLTDPFVSLGLMKAIEKGKHTVTELSYYRMTKL